MRYVLGIDLGAGHTAATVSRPVGGSGTGWSEPETVPLGTGTVTVPSALCVLPDGSVRAGEPEPAGKGWVVRGFGRRVGDEVPLIVAGEPYTGQALLAALGLWVVDRVDEREGGRADQIVVSHPGSWGPYRIELLHRALWRAGLDAVTLLPAPVAAAESYAAGSPVGSGAVLAVLDLDSGEAAVVRRADLGAFELLGAVTGAADAEVDGYPGGIGPLLDDALFAYVGDRLRPRLDELDPGDPGIRERIGRLRAECAAARRRLITEAETVVTVELAPAAGLGSATTSVAVTRSGFEELVRPLLVTVADTVRAAVRSCGLTPRELAAVVLAGEAARTPLVAKLVGAALPVPSVVGAQPELRIAQGAALAAQRIADGLVNLPVVGAGEEIQRYDQYGGHQEYADSYVGTDLVETYDPDQAVDYADYQPTAGYAGEDPVDPPPRPPVTITPLDLPGRRKRRPSPRPRRSRED